MDFRNLIIQLLYDKIEPLVEKAFNYPVVSALVFVITISLFLVIFFRL